MSPRLNLCQANQSEAMTDSPASDQVKTPPASRLKQIRNVLGNLGLAQAIRAKSRLSDPGDQHEQDANRVGDRVMGMNSADTETTSVEDHSAIQDMPGDGRRLNPSVRAFFESRFDHNLSHVRIHTGPDAAEASRQINARAFTAGSDVVFGAGEYQPESHEGRRLIAHELAHVVQGDLHGAQSQIMRQPTGETPASDPNKTSPATPAGPQTEPEPVRPESKVDWKLSDLLIYPLFVDVFKDVILKDLTAKERKEFGLKGSEAAAFYVWTGAAFLPIGGLGGEKYQGGFSKGLSTWSNYVDAIEPLSLSKSVMIDGISRIVGLRVDDYLASDLFKMRLKTHILSVIALGTLAQTGYSIYKGTSGPGDAGELESVSLARHTGLASFMLNKILKEQFKAPDFFDISPLQIKTHPAFGATQFAGEPPPSGVAGDYTEEVGGGGKQATAMFNFNLPKLFSLAADDGPKAADMGDLQKYRGWQTSLWFNYNKLNPTTAMTAAGKLPEEKVKGGVIFGGGGHLGMLEVGARYDGTAARELTSWMLKGGFGYSGTKGSVVNRLGFTATYVDWTEKDILAPRSETGAPYGGQAMQFTPFTKLEFGSEQHKFEVGAALSFVTGTKEPVGVSDLRGDLSYTYMGDSEEKLPRFKIDLSGSFHRLDWFDPLSPKMWGLQAKGSAGRAFGGVEVMTGAEKIPDWRAGLIDKPEKVRVPTAVQFTAGYSF